VPAVAAPAAAGGVAGSGTMIGRLAWWPRRRQAALSPALEARLDTLDARVAGLERSLAVKLEAQLVTATQALAEVIAAELARERRRMEAGRAQPQAGAGAATRRCLLTRPASEITGYAKDAGQAKETRR
jgi:hypothetical protein